MGTWASHGASFPDWEDNQYVETYRMTKSTFWYLCRRYGWQMRKQSTCIRCPVPFQKRFAIVIHWLAQDLSFTQLARIYCVGKSTAVCIVHLGVSVPREHLVPESILFPTGPELSQVICDFEALCGLPCCGGAIDGTFMPIVKPTNFGDSYWCYKHFCAIIVLGCVDARGIFTSVNSGRPGSVGDSYTFKHSALQQNIDCGKWLSARPQRIRSVDIRPFLVADAAFSLSPTCMKCYDSQSQLTPEQFRFNYALIRSRRVVEQAFGRLKGRWKVNVVQRSRVRDPVFASTIATVCCALHNVCERHNCKFEESWLPDPAHYQQDTPQQFVNNTTVGSASTIRDALAVHVYHTFN